MSEICTRLDDLIIWHLVSRLIKFHNDNRNYVNRWTFLLKLHIHAGLWSTCLSCLSNCKDPVLTSKCNCTRISYERPPTSPQLQPREGRVSRERDVAWVGLFLCTLRWRTHFRTLHNHHHVAEVVVWRIFRMPKGKGLGEVNPPTDKLWVKSFPSWIPLDF